MQELSWKDTEDLVVMQPSVIPFSLMVSQGGIILGCFLSVVYLAMRSEREATVSGFVFYQC